MLVLYITLLFLYGNSIGTCLQSIYCFTLSVCIFVFFIFFSSCDRQAQDKTTRKVVQLIPAFYLLVCDMLANMSAFHIVCRLLCIQLCIMEMFYKVQVEALKQWFGKDIPTLELLLFLFSEKMMKWHLSNVALETEAGTNDTQNVKVMCVQKRYLYSRFFEQLVWNWQVTVQVVTE